MNQTSKKRILIVKPLMTNTRYHFGRTIALSKYFDVDWIIHHGHYGIIDTEKYNSVNHNIFLIGKKPKKNNFFYNNIWLIPFYTRVIKHLRKTKYDLVLVHLERFCFILPLFAPKNNFVLQLFTAAVSGSNVKNTINNLEQKFHILFFKNILIGTEWMKEKFKLYKKNVICPKWGHTPISHKLKYYNDIKLLYLGTLTNRNIHETIEGLGIYLKNHRVNCQITYDIIGSGKVECEERIRSAISLYDLDNVVKLHGYLGDEQIVDFFDNCNVGVAYIPITDYYTNVVASKLIEYLLSGMVTIATETNENSKIVTCINGVLIKDNPVSFAKGLQEVYKKLNGWSSQKILNDAEKMSIEYNIENEVVPSLKSIMQMST